MSYRDAIYSQLATDPELTGMLATKPPEFGSGPAIYEQWAAAGSEMPYINLRYSFGRGDSLAKRDGVLNVDIFTGGYNTRTAETINRRVIDLLDIQNIRDEEDGPIYLFLGLENEIPEEEEGITHLNTTFRVIYWRKTFMSRLRERHL